MNYLSTNDIAKKWGICQRRVLKLAKEGRIPGAVFLGKHWMIPENAEKPVDGRTKKGKQNVHQHDAFRFPLFLNFDIHTYSPPLSEEEKRLREAQIDFYACRFDKAITPMKELADTAQNRYVRISAMYFNCLLSVVANGTENFEVCYAKFQTSLSEDFPHQKEMTLFSYMLGNTLSLNADLYRDFSIDMNEPYHPSVNYILFYLTFVICGNQDLSLIKKLNFNFAEVICRQMSCDGYACEEQVLHGCLISIYQMQKNTDLMLYHVKQLLEIAQKKEFYWLAVIYKTYYPIEFNTVLADFPEDFTEKITELNLSISSKYSKFIGKYTDFALFTILSPKDYQYVFFATQGYSNKEIAKHIHSTANNVANKYHAIYTKLGVNNKAQLIEIFYQTLFGTSE